MCFTSTGELEKMGLEKMGQGWKKWDRVGKNGTSFCPLIFPNKLVHPIMQDEILTVKLAIRKFLSKRGHLWWQYMTFADKGRLKFTENPE